MKPKERRAAARVDIDVQGTLYAGGGATPCRLLNVCDRGFLIEAQDALPVGDRVGLAVPLTANAPIHCTVQIRHVNQLRLGALVVEMSEADRQQWREFLVNKRSAR